MKSDLPEECATELCVPLSCVQHLDSLFLGRMIEPKLPFEIVSSSRYAGNLSYSLPNNVDMWFQRRSDSEAFSFVKETVTSQTKVGHECQSKEHFGGCCAAQLGLADSKKKKDLPRSPSHTNKGRNPQC